MQESELFYTLSHFNDYSNRGVIMDIFEFAMDREKHAEINYLKLAASSSSSSLKSIFERLSYDEKKHLEIIRKMKEDYLIAEKKKGTNAKRIVTMLVRSLLQSRSLSVCVTIVFNSAYSSYYSRKVVFCDSR